MPGPQTVGSSRIMARVDEEPILHSATRKALLTLLPHSLRTVELESAKRNFVEKKLKDTFGIVFEEALQKGSRVAGHHGSAISGVLNQAKRLITFVNPHLVPFYSNHVTSSKLDPVFQTRTPVQAKEEALIFDDKTELPCSSGLLLKDEAFVVRLQLAVLRSLATGDPEKDGNEEDIAAAIIAAEPSWLGSLDHCEVLSKRLTTLIDHRAAELAGRIAVFLGRLDSDGQAVFQLGLLHVEGIRAGDVLGFKVSDRFGSFLGVLASQWSERISRALIGSCGLFQIPGAILSSRLETSTEIAFGSWDCSNPPEFFGPLNDRSELGPFLSDKEDIRERLSGFWIDTFKKLSRIKNQESLRLALSDVSKGLKNVWAANIAFLPEGQEAHDSLSQEDGENILKDLFKGSPVGDWLEDFQAFVTSLNRSGYPILTPHERVNLSRSFAILPIPSQPPVTRQGVEEEMAKAMPLEESQLTRLEISYLRSTISLQQRLRAKAFSKGLALSKPQQIDRETGVRSARSHWAESTQAWQALSEEEREIALSVDFTVALNPTDWFVSAPIAVADRSVLNPAPKPAEKGKRSLEVLESLRSAPLMFGLDALGLRESLAEPESHLLAGTYKPESGKYRKRRLFSAGTTSAKAAFRELDANGRLLTSLLDELTPGMGAAQVTASMNRLDRDIVNRSAGVLAISADISAWSTNHKRRLVRMTHAMLAASTGFPADSWDKAIAGSAYIVQESLLDDCKVSVPWDEGTFQGFTVFNDTALHASLWQSAIRDAKREAALTPWSRQLLYMDDTVVSVESSRPEISKQELKKVKQRLISSFEDSTGMMVDSLKSLVGHRKFIFLNKIRIKSTEVPSFAKLLTRPKVSFAAIDCDLESIRAQLALAKDLVEARLNPFFAYALQVKIALCVVRDLDLETARTSILDNPLKTIFALTRPLSLKGASGAGFSVVAKVQSKDPAANHVFHVECLVELFNILKEKTDSKSRCLLKNLKRHHEAVKDEHKFLTELLSRDHSPEKGYNRKKLTDVGLGFSEPLMIVNNKVLYLLSRGTKSPLWKELLEKARNPDRDEEDQLLKALKGQDLSLAETIRDAFPNRVLRDFLGKLTSKRLLKELMTPFEIYKLAALLRRKSKEFLLTLFKGTSFSEDSEELPDHDVSFKKGSKLLKLLEKQRASALREHGLHFENLSWPHPAYNIAVDVTPKLVPENRWVFLLLPEENSVSGMAGKMEDKGAYLVRRPSGAPKHKVPELLQRIQTGARDLAEMEALIPSLAGIGMLFEKAWGIPGIADEARQQLPPGLSRKQLATAVLTKSLAPIDISLDKALKIEIAVPGTGSLRVHGQEVRSFIRNALILGVHAGVFRQWSFQIIHRPGSERMADPPLTEQILLATAPEESELSDILRELHYGPLTVGKSDEGKAMLVDPRVSSAKHRYFLRGEVSECEATRLMRHFLAYDKISLPRSCLLPTQNFDRKESLPLDHVFPLISFQLSCLLDAPRLASVLFQEPPRKKVTLPKPDSVRLPVLRTTLVEVLHQIETSQRRLLKRGAISDTAKTLVDLLSAENLRELSEQSAGQMMATVVAQRELNFSRTRIATALEEQILLQESQSFRDASANRRPDFSDVPVCQLAACLRLQSKDALRSPRLTAIVDQAQTLVESAWRELSSTTPMRLLHFWLWSSCPVGSLDWQSENALNEIINDEVLLLKRKACAEHRISQEKYQTDTATSFSDWVNESAEFSHTLFDSVLSEWKVKKAATSVKFKALLRLALQQMMQGDSAAWIPASVFELVLLLGNYATQT